MNYSFMNLFLALIVFILFFAQMKKWAGRIICHLMQRYGNPRYADEVYKEFSKFFAANYAIQLLSPVFTVLGAKMNGAFISDDVFRSCVTFIANSCEMSVTYKIIKPHLNSILFNVIFPGLCLTSRDVELFHEDPQEFISKNHQQWDDVVDPRSATSYLLNVSISVPLTASVATVLVV